MYVGHSTASYISYALAHIKGPMSQATVIKATGKRLQESDAVVDYSITIHVAQGWGALIYHGDELECAR